MQYDSYVCQFAATNLSVNMAIAGHESVEVNYRETIPHTTIWKKIPFPTLVAIYMVCFSLLILKIYSAESYGFELEQKNDWGSSLSTGYTLPLVSPSAKPFLHSML